MLRVVLKVVCRLTLLRDAFENGTQDVLSLSYMWSFHKRGGHNTLQVVFSNAPQVVTPLLRKNT